MSPSSSSDSSTSEKPSGELDSREGDPFAPHVFEFDLPCTPSSGLEIYVARIGEWWDPQYTANRDTLQDVTIEPRVGGRVYESHVGREPIEWGRVTHCDPAGELDYTFSLAQEYEPASQVTVRFEPREAGCHVRHEQGGWVPSNLADRSRYRHWPRILNQFAQLVRTAGETGRSPIV